MMFSHLLRDSDAVLVAPNAIRVRLNELICLIRGAWPLSQEMPVGKYFVGDEVITKNIAGPGSGVLRCDWGCALTVQKAEGSEWGRVLVVDHGADDKVGQKSWNCLALPSLSALGVKCTEYDTCRMIHHVGRMAFEDAFLEP